MSKEEIRISLKPQWWWPLAAGVLVGIALRLIYNGQPGEPYNAMMGSFAILAPTAVAAVAVFIAELRARRTWAYYFWMGAFAAGRANRHTHNRRRGRGGRRLGSAHDRGRDPRG